VKKFDLNLLNLYTSSERRDVVVSVSFFGGNLGGSVIVGVVLFSVSPFVVVLLILVVDTFVFVVVVVRVGLSFREYRWIFVERERENDTSFLV